MWDYGGTTVEDLITDRESDRVSKSCEKSATAAESMKSKIEKLEPKKGIKDIGMVGIENTFIVTTHGGKCITGDNPGLIPII